MTIVDRTIVTGPSWYTRFAARAANSNNLVQG